MFKQHISTALVHIRRSPYQAIAAIAIMTLTFFAATTFALVAYVLSVTINYFETRPQIIAFLKNDATPAEVSNLTQKTVQDTRVKGEVRYVSHEEAFRIFKDTTDNPLATELVPADVLPASLEFSVSDLSFAQEVIDEFKKEKIVERVEFTGSLGGEANASQVIKNLQKVTSYTRIGGATLLLFLSFTAILTLLIVIGMRVSVRREEINVLTLMGATPAFVRLPFLFEGIIYAAAGAFSGFLIATLLILYLIPNIKFYFGEIPVIPEQILDIGLYFGALLLIEIVAAIVVGLAGAWFAISRYLKI